jgi:PAS domain S-box-containing protein
MNMPSPSPDVSAAPHPLQREVDELRARLAEAEETLHAIRQGDVDAVVVSGASGPQVYTLLSADRPYRTFVERMQEGALTLTPDGTILYANQRFASFLGLGLRRVVGQNFGQFIAADDRALFDELLAVRDPAGGRSEIALRAADGEAVPVYLSMVELIDEGQTTVSAIVTDLRWPKLRMQELTEANAKLVTVMAERERAEAMLRQSQKMEAVGQLTAGIAHDFNNLLAVLSGNLELFLSRTSDEWLKRRVEAGQRAVERGARLTQQLLAFSRRQSLRPDAISVNALLLDIEPLLRSSVGDGIRLTMVLGEELAHCLVDSTELQASILNLVMNAKDAMPGGGCLTITTAEADLDGGPSGGAGPMRDGGYLSIAVTDTGHGMLPEIRDRAFDPFFTTKDVGKGTGLGLSQVYGFIRQSDGHVTIESVPGAGTSVRLYLPRAEAVVMAPKSRADIAVRQGGRQARVPQSEPLAGLAHSAPLAGLAHSAPLARLAHGAPLARRVLVVEDDPDVRELVVEVLESLGYDTVTAASGPLALNLLESGMAVDVVVSDVVMPDGMSGFQLARAIRRRLPRLAIVLTSGMTRLAAAAEDAMQGLPILHKPYRCEDLAQAIDAALDAVLLEQTTV